MLLCLTDTSLYIYIYVKHLGMANNKNSTFCPLSCIYVFCLEIRTNSDYIPIQH